MAFRTNSFEKIDLFKWGKRAIFWNQGILQRIKGLEMLISFHACIKVKKNADVFLAQ